MRLFAMTGIVLLVSSGAFAQDVGIAREKRQQEEAAAVLKKQLAEAQMRVPIENLIKGAPYSADVITESSQALADGNHISQKSIGHVYRDGEGRTRREQGSPASVQVGNAGVTLETNTISIVDPVAGYSYSLDAERKVAWRTPLGTGGIAELKKKLEAEQLANMKAEQGEVASRARGGAPAEPGGGPTGAERRARGGARGDGSIGPLQQKVIDGVPVEGRVNTRVIPAGAIGNDLPITITSEEWTSPELHVLVMTRHSDPRSGDTTYRLTNVVRAEPDPSLFMVPPDYTIKDTGIRRPEPR